MLVLSRKIGEEIIIADRIRVKVVGIQGNRVKLGIVAPEDLILPKLEWANESKSEVQLKDVKNLLQSVKQLNRRYLTRWAKQLGVDSLYREVSQ